MSFKTIEMRRARRSLCTPASALVAIAAVAAAGPVFLQGLRVAGVAPSAVEAKRALAAKCSRLLVGCSAFGATIDRPPPPAELDEGDGSEGYEVRFLSNEEREYHANLWLPLAAEEDRAILEKQVLPFRSTQMFTGKSRLCVGAFVGPQCEGLATTEVVPDFSDFASFFVQKRCMRCLTLVTKPRTRTEAGGLIVRAVKQLADESGYRADFEPLQELAGGRYWVLARSL